MSQQPGDPKVRPFRVRQRQSAARSPRRPSWLSGRAAKLWDRQAPLLASAGWLDEITATGFATLCELHADVRELENLADELGPEKAISSGVASTLLEAQRQLLDYFRAYFMTPLSRAEQGVTFKPGA